MWAGQLAGLAHLRRCVAIDLPGHGRSAAGSLDLAAVLDALGAPVADVVGHSWGGHEVLALWRRAPSRVRTLALSGVMFSSEQPGAFAGTARPVPLEDQPGVVASLSVPLVVVTGADDDRTPPAACARLAAAAPSGRFVEIPDAGHLAPWERPDLFNALLRELWTG
jgi:pimeloyl-ACP methyl ester carboxylesterase